MTIKIWIIIIIIGAFVIGISAIILRLLKVVRKIDFANEYRSNFISFANRFYKNYDSGSRTSDFDGEKYTWLTMNVSKIQNMLDSFERMTFRPAFANYIYNDYQIIVNTLLKFRIGGVDNLEISLVDDCLLRYIGNLEEYRVEVLKKLKNPIQWFKEGIDKLLSLFLLSFYWFGILGQRSTNRIMNSLIYKFISGIVALTIFLSGLVTIFVGYERTLDVIKGFIK